MKNTVAIIGRPNTGKSTLFNKILGKRESIISKDAGTTRDIIVKDTNWQGVDFKIFDTGGIDLKTETDLEKNIQLQTEVAIETSDVILFLINIKEGAKSEDIQIVNRLKKTKNNIILVASKTDTNLLREESLNLYKLGLDKPFPISATKGSGVGDLLDKVISYLDKEEDDNESKHGISVSILGKPNVGKSSLFNAISKENKVIVSEEEGTTRDTVNTVIKYKDNNIIITDTAGLRRKSKIKSEIEKISSYKSLQNIKNSEICLLLTDATQNLSRQDARIVTRIVENKKCIILVVNKWDKVRLDKTKKENKTKIREHMKCLKSYFPFITWAPIVFISAKHKENISDILESILAINKEKSKKVDERELNTLFKKINRDFYKQNSRKESNKYFIQSNNNPKRFILYIKKRSELPDAYLNFLKKGIRKRFGFIGTPIEINVKKM
ncbi:MAG: ribosome biogenesis GTPase Der [Parcubacteria group bacterium]|nr:ribosome biogenesis GTPase Der [Parcubacteria group bacterium]